MEGQESVVEKIEQQRFGDHPDFSIRVSPLDFDPVENVPQWAHQFIGCEVTDEFYKHFTNEKRIFPNLKLMGWTCEFTWDGNDELGDPDEYRYVRYLSVFFSERCRQKVIKSITIQRETLFHTNSNWLDHSESDRWEVIREDTEPQIELYEKLLKSCTKPYLYYRLMDRIVEIALMGRVTFAWDGQIFYGKIDFIRGLPRHVRTSCTFRQLLKIMCHAQTRIEALFSKEYRRTIGLDPPQYCDNDAFQEMLISLYPPTVYSLLELRESYIYRKCKEWNAVREFFDVDNVMWCAHIRAKLELIIS